MLFVKFNNKTLQRGKKRPLIVQTLGQQLFFFLFAFLVLTGRALFVAWEAIWTRRVLAGGGAVMEK